jgi:hypothetical protein
MHQAGLQDLEEIYVCSECMQTAAGRLVMCFLYGDPLGVLYLLPSRYRYGFVVSVIIIFQILLRICCINLSR